MLFPVLLFQCLGGLMTRKKHPWFRARKYLHFDSPIKYCQALKIVTTPQAVAQHSFYPLITYQISSEKIKRDNDTGRLVKKTKDRPIAYASHVDSHIYSYYALQLSNLYEVEIERRGIDESILAFRTLGKSNIDFAADAFQKIKDKGNCSAVALDVTGFFDNLNHQYLKTVWAGLLGIPSLPEDHYALFKSLTKYSMVERKALYDCLGLSHNNPKRERFRLCDPVEFRNKVRGEGLIENNSLKKGIPQGTPISALLSNIYMIDFDELMCQAMKKLDGAYFRYCDDMLFVVPSEKRDEIAGFVKQNIQRIHVDINTDKTELRTFKVTSGVQHSDKPLQYLGFTYDGSRILIRSAALARYSERMKRGVRFAKATMRKRNKAKGFRGEGERELFKKKLYGRYSHLGQRNFLRYGYRAAEKMESQAIKKQLKPLWDRLQHEIEKW
jgi:hypothetical protein